jgi:hypothetical protein
MMSGASSASRRIRLTDDLPNSLRLQRSGDEITFVLQRARSRHQASPGDRH